MPEIAWEDFEKVDVRVGRTIGPPSRPSRRQWASELGPQGVRVVWLRTTGLPETIPDTGDAVTDLGTGFGEDMTREEISASMREQTILKRLASLDELGKVATFMASDEAGPMTSTFANITCGAILD